MKGRRKKTRRKQHTRQRKKGERYNEIVMSQTDRERKKERRERAKHRPLQASVGVSSRWKEYEL